MRRMIRSAGLAAFILGLCNAGSGWPQSGPSGVYNFVRDSDGTGPSKGAAVTLAFTPGTGSVAFNAVRPGETSSDTGSYRVSGALITLTLPNLGISVNNQPYILTGSTLVLPFKLFSEGAGTSTWAAANGQGGSGSSGAGSGRGAGSGGSGGQGSQGGSGGQGGGRVAGRPGEFRQPWGPGRQGKPGLFRRAGCFGESGELGRQGTAGCCGHLRR